MRPRSYPRTSKTAARIARVRTFHLRCELPEAIMTSQARITSREALLVQIETDGGLVGWGECSGPSAIAQAAIEHYYAPLLLGRDALQTDGAWQEMWRASLRWGRRGATVAAMSGLDIALWDLKGLAFRRPVSDLLGGRVRERVPCYATGLYFRDRPEAELIPDLIDEAHGYIEAGFRAVKTQIGRTPAYDTALIYALRDALPGATLYADARHAYDLPEAAYIGRALEEAGFALFEEPLSPEHPQAYRQLASQVRIPLGAGEVEQTCFGFHQLLTPGGVSVVQPVVAYCGGLSEALRIRTLAATLGLNVLPNVGGTMLSLSAALHFLASDHRQPGRLDPSLGALGRAGEPNPLRDAIWDTVIEIDNGGAIVPTVPGLGVAVNINEMRGFCVRETETRI